MTEKPRPASARALALLEKLQALADHGIDGEKAAAQAKLARLRQRFDFTASRKEAVPDLFSGKFKRSGTARKIWSFEPGEFDVANSIKWALESATKIPCVYQQDALCAEASAPTAKRLQEIATHIAHQFRTLLKIFGQIDGINVTDRASFLRGLYDGMMNESRLAGESLPKPAPRAGKTRRAKAAASSSGSTLNVHPYTLGVGLGKQIRFSIPVEQVNAELEAMTQKRLAPEAGISPPMEPDRRALQSSAQRA